MTSYLSVLQQACKINNDLELSPAGVERIWRAASGAAHGKRWPNVELRRPSATAPPELSSILVPDTGAMVEALEAAYRMTQLAALKHADYAGADIAGLLAAAWDWLASQITLKEGVVALTAEELLRTPEGEPKNDEENTPS